MLVKQNTGRGKRAARVTNRNAHIGAPHCQGRMCNNHIMQPHIEHATLYVCVLCANCGTHSQTRILTLRKCSAKIVLNSRNYDINHQSTCSRRSYDYIALISIAHKVDTGHCES